MSYTNATFYLDYEGGSDSARTALTSVAVANNGSGLVRCTKAAHGLVTGAVGDVTLNYVGAWMITVIDANNFDLVGSTYSTSTAVTFTPRGGSSKADAWKTVTNGVTAARHAAGDTIRVMASPDETSLGQSATWTQNSKIITLTSAVTATISDCETAWTASGNVTSTADATLFKENTKSAKHVIATAFTTGLVAFFATGTLDLSTYQQVSFWIENTAALAASTLSLRLCSDVAGVTTVNTIAIPAIPSTGQWVPITVDTGGALGSSIKSVALYADLDPGTQTIQLDNIIACKASSSADSLTLTSLIGKVHNVSWVASTTYSAGDIRIPTPGNRNGLRYTASAGSTGSSEPIWPTLVGGTVVDSGVTWTCEGVEDTWYGIQSISGTTVKLDNIASTLGNAGRGYGGETETVATYKRETVKLALATNTTDTLTATQRSGTATAGITYSGGWNRTDMATQTGETWFSLGNGSGYGFYAPHAWITLSNISIVRAYRAMWDGVGPMTVRNCHFNNCTSAGCAPTSATTTTDMNGMVCNNNGIVGMYISPGNTTLRNVRVENNNGDGVYDNSVITVLRVEHATIRNNNGYAVKRDGAAATDWKLHNLTTGNNSAAIASTSGRVVLFNCSLPEITEFATMAANQDYRIYSQKHDATADNHYIWTDGGTIISATDQRNTASGVSWKFRPTSTSRDSSYPLKLSVAKIACTSGVAVNVNIYTRRDNTNIKGLLCVEGGQIGGIELDITVACEPSINTWANSGTLTFTPAENGVVEVSFKVWDGVGTTNNYWIDDLQIA